MHVQWRCKNQRGPENSTNLGRLLGVAVGDQVELNVLGEVAAQQRSQHLGAEQSTLSIPTPPVSLALAAGSLMFCTWPLSSKPSDIVSRKQFYKSYITGLDSRMGTGSPQRTQLERTPADQSDHSAPTCTAVIAGEMDPDNSPPNLCHINLCAVLRFLGVAVSTLQGG